MQSSNVNSSIVEAMPEGEFSLNDARMAVRVVRAKSYRELQEAVKTIAVAKIVSGNTTHLHLNFVEKLVKEELSVREEVAKNLGELPK